jgi:hypothetical protein
MDVQDLFKSENSKMIGAGIAVVVLIAVLWWWFRYRKSDKTTTSSSSGGDKVTIYGSLGCPYTVKQMQKYPNHEFVDCTTEKCPSFVTAYPTTKMSDGKVEVGFS